MYTCDVSTICVRVGEGRQRGQTMRPTPGTWGRLEVEAKQTRVILPCFSFAASFQTTSSLHAIPHLRPTHLVEYNPLGRGLIIQHGGRVDGDCLVLTHRAVSLRQERRGWAGESAQSPADSAGTMVAYSLLLATRHVWVSWVGCLRA